MRTRPTAAAALLAALALAAPTLGAQEHAPARRQYPSGNCVPARSSAPADTTPLPPTIASSGRVLTATLAIVADSVVVDGCRYARNLYAAESGGRRYPASAIPPTLRLMPGDSLDLTVISRMSVNPVVVDTFYGPRPRSNFHFHGFNVTPARMYGDQVVTVAFDSGQSHRYAFRLPPDHPMGMHWYHPHPHGISDAQVAGGMAGAILVGDVRGRIPGGGAIPERVMLFRDFQPWGPQHSGGSIFTVNGEVQGRFTLPGGSRQVWHLANVGGDTYLGLKLIDPRGRPLPFTVLARDGNPVAVPERADSLMLSPAARFDVLVEAPRARAIYRLVNADSSNAVNGYGATLATVETDTPFAAPPSGRPSSDPAVARRVAALLARRVDQRRTVKFTLDPKIPERFLLNDSAYDPARILVLIQAGTVEEWSLTNPRMGDEGLNAQHVFHIHQGDFLVTREDGKAVTPNGFQDRVDLERGDSVVIRMAFDDPWQIGLYVFHCHVLFHEDFGMMQNVCVYPRTAAERGGLTPERWCDGQLPHLVGNEHTRH